MSTFSQVAKSFVKSSSINLRLLNLYDSIGKPKPFDVTLRDGLQALTNEEQKLITTEEKLKIYSKIIENHEPKNIEIGSFVSGKILPVFKDTDILLNKINKSNKFNEINNYVLVPNFSQLQTALKEGAKNFSFITSVSDSFQFKNTKMSLKENLTNIHDMVAYLDDYSNTKIDTETEQITECFHNYNIKLYVSCINECPIEGKIDNNFIVRYLKKLSKIKANKICLSDTCGTLTREDFITILEKSKKIGLDIKKFSLHLHVKPEREIEVQDLMFIALDNGINEFDVSELSSGGCSVTMDKDKIAPNMNYEQYYKFLINYLLSRM
jgi:hydroxymethylglutaryl-CoA lyase